MWPQVLLLLLACAGMAARLSWSAVSAAGCICVVISWYSPGRCSEETSGGLGRLSEVST